MDEQDERIARKEYYAIGEVCDLTGLRPHVLRYWESQFEVLHPTKNRAGNRVFRPKDIELILLVKHLLYDRKFTIEGARQKLDEMKRAGELEGGRQGVLDPELLPIYIQRLGREQAMQGKSFATLQIFAERGGM